MSNFSLEDEKRIDAKSILKSICRENTNKLVFVQININLLRNKFELHVNEVKGNIDVLLISETKIDRGSLGGGILLHVREDIPSNLLEVETKPIVGFYVEINLHNDKWLINCSSNPHKNTIG